MLEQNYLTCLKEKSAKDAVETRKCNVEYILWYLVDCPTYVTKLRGKNMFNQRVLSVLSEEE